MFHRQDMHKMLMDSATQEQGTGTPVKLVVNHKVLQNHIFTHLTRSLHMISSEADMLIIINVLVHRSRHFNRPHHIRQRLTIPTRRRHRSRRHRVRNSENHRHPCRQTALGFQLLTRQRQDLRRRIPRLRKLQSQQRHRILGRPSQLEQNCFIAL